MSLQNQSIDLVSLIRDSNRNYNFEKITDERNIVDNFVDNNFQLLVLPPSEIFRDNNYDNLHLPSSNIAKICMKIQFITEEERMINFPYGFTLWEGLVIPTFPDADYEHINLKELNLKQCDLVILIGQFSYYRDPNNRLIYDAYIGDNDKGGIIGLYRKLDIPTINNGGMIIWFIIKPLIN